MLIRVGYDIQFDLPCATPIVAQLSIHPSRESDVIGPNEMKIEPAVPTGRYLDSFGNRCTRLMAPAGRLRLSNSVLVYDSGQPDPVNTNARECEVRYLPNEILTFLLPSRYCEVDRFSNIAFELFGATPPGWQRVQAICDWVHERVKFDYGQARPTKSALDVLTERVGVCRDFQHLAITFCRALNIPARYATGYLGDIGVPPGGPMDFSAWFQVFLEDRWWTFDARHNLPRVGRILMATGRDAADVAMTTSFGTANLCQFSVVTKEVETPALEHLLEVEI